MEQTKTILIKLTGEIFNTQKNTPGESPIVHAVIKQIAQLHQQYRLGIVIGGGNYFRGSKQGAQIGLNPWYAHTIGMFATVMNGLALADLLEQQGIPTTLFSAIGCPHAGQTITPEAVNSALAERRCIVFAGGTGNPFFTTDTNAILRAIQIGAHQIWKAGPASGVYDSDPQTTPTAHFLPDVTYSKALELKLQIMDMSAFALAAEHNLQIRVFDIFTSDALLIAARDQNFGSLIHV